MPSLRPELTQMQRQALSLLARHGYGYSVGGTTQMGQRYLYVNARVTKALRAKGLVTISANAFNPKVEMTPSGREAAK